MSEDFNPDAFLAANAAQTPEAAPAEATPEDVSNFDPDEFLKESSHEKYGTLGQQVLTGAEGVARGFLGPVAPLAELGLSKLGVPGLSAEEQTARQEENPWVHGVSETAGLGAGLFLGTGEAGLAAKGAEAAAAATGFGKFGASALKGAIETGLIQGGDEISKSILGQGDPETPVASALAHVGAAAFMGGTLGGIFKGVSGKLKDLGEARAGTKVAQFIEDFGNKWKFNTENPDLMNSVFTELKPFFEENRLLRKGVYAAGGAKDQALQHLLPQSVDESIIQHSIDMHDAAQGVLKNMIKDGVGRGARNEFQQTINRYVEAVGNAKDPFSYFKAADTLKKELGEYVPWGQLKSGQLMRTDPNYSFIKNAAKMYDAVADSLENQKTWGDAGSFQRDLNQAVKKFIPADKDFGTFTQKIQGDRSIDPTKIKTYLRQVGKSGADISEEIRPQKMKNYVESAEAFRNEINDSYARRGLKSDLQPLSLNSVKSTYGGVPGGAAFADKLFHFIIPNFAAHISGEAGGIGGAYIGYREDGVKGAVAGGIAGLFAPHAAELVGRKITRSAVPALLKVISSGKSDGVQQFLDYAAQADRGAQKINSGVESLFKGAGQQAIDAYASSADRESLRKYIESGKQDQFIQEHNQKMNQPAVQPQQGFAHGGDVSAKLAEQPKQNSNNSLAEYAPAQNMILQTARARINGYLNSQRPLKNINKPMFDKDFPDKQKDRSYNKLLDLANQPLSILNDIKSGSLTAENMKHFTSLYPELHGHLSKKITEMAVKQKMRGEIPSYKMRQSLGLFLGTNLDSSMTPQSIAAAQGVFSKNKPPAQSPTQEPKTKKSTSSLGKASNSLKTTDQAAISRQQNDH